MQALTVPMVRRHTRTAEGEHHYGPAVGVISGNYVTGRRRGTVDGIDFGGTGSGQCQQHLRNPIQFTTSTLPGLQGYAISLEHSLHNSFGQLELGSRSI